MIKVKVSSVEHLARARLSHFQEIVLSRLRSCVYVDSHQVLINNRVAQQQIVCSMHIVKVKRAQRSAENNKLHVLP